MDSYRNHFTMIIVATSFFFPSKLNLRNSTQRNNEHVRDEINC